MSTRSASVAVVVFLFAAACGSSSSSSSSSGSSGSSVSDGLRCTRDATGCVCRRPPGEADTNANLCAPESSEICCADSGWPTMSQSACRCQAPTGDGGTPCAGFTNAQQVPACRTSTAGSSSSTSSSSSSSSSSGGEKCAPKTGTCEDSGDCSCGAGCLKTSNCSTCSMYCVFPCETDAECVEMSKNHVAPLTRCKSVSAGYKICE